MGGLQSSDLIIVAGRPGMGKTALGTNIAFNIAKAWQGELQPDGAMKTVNGGIVGFFSLEMSSGAARHPYHRRAVGSFVGQYPARAYRRERVRAHRRCGA